MAARLLERQVDQGSMECSMTKQASRPAPEWTEMDYDLVVRLAELPQVVIYGVVGGVGGLFGALLGMPLANRFPRAAAVTAAISTTLAVQATSRIILPKLDRMAFEAGFVKGIGKLPRQIDEATILESAGVDGDTINYRYTVTIEIEDREAAREAIQEMLASDPGCEKVTGLLEHYVSHLNYTYETNLGEIVVPLRSGDCRGNQSRS
jgi:hypothetical protein